MARCAHVYKDTPKARERNRVGKQCAQFAVNETPYCKFHGGNAEQVIDKARRERYEAEITEAVARETATTPPRTRDQDGTNGFTGLWDENHAMLDPFSLLLWEIRRCGARIEWFDRQIEALGREKDIWWGMTKREKIGAAEFSGTNRTYEARENVLVKMQNEERKRLVALRDEWQNNRFEALKVAGYGAFREAMRNALKVVLNEFEVDLTDEVNQARLRRALETLPDPIPAIEAPTGHELKKVEALRR